MKKIVENAPAKINLTLEVLEKRRDGFHNIMSVMQTVTLFDVIEITEADTFDISISNTDISPENNIVRVAYKKLKDVTGISEYASINVKKNIPVRAGLGGGSSDAAATLRGLNKLWNLKLSRENLIDIGNEIGSDVPFFITGGCSLVRGRGEIIEPLPVPKLGTLLMCSPSLSGETFQNKTEFMFSRLLPNMYTIGNLSLKLAARIAKQSDCHPSFFFNVFSELIFEHMDLSKKIRSTYKKIGINEFNFTGSGPSSFVMVPHKELGTLWKLFLEKHLECTAYIITPTGPITLDKKW